MKAKNWTKDELLACFNLYCRIPFGRLHRGTPEIIAAASSLGRTPSAVAMKLVNFASFDPLHRARNVKGLTNVSRQDRALWDEFQSDSNRIAEESEAAFERLISGNEQSALKEFDLPEGPTESIRTRSMRLVQGFFRRAVTSSYSYRCSFCRLPIKALLSASHIVPWSVSVELRADPRNGICLCALHDRAFDRGLITVESDLTITLSPKALHRTSTSMHKAAFLDLAGTAMELPHRFPPKPECLEHHRNFVFQSD